MTGVLFFAEDPGAINFLGQIPGRLAEAGVVTQVVACGLACAHLDRLGMPFTRWPGSAAEVLDRFDPLVVVTGTSDNERSPAFPLIEAARQRGLLTVGGVDSPADADRRFSGESGRPLRYAPDWVTVPDQATRAAFLAFGLGAERVVAVGNPLCDLIRARRPGLERQRDGLRTALFPDAAGRPLLVFLGEPVHRLAAERYARMRDWTLSGRGGANARTQVCAEEFLDAAARLPQHPYTVLRLHPKDRLDDYEPLQREFDAVSIGGDPAEVVAAADGVVGITSTLLMEAALLGSPTGAIVPYVGECQRLPMLAAGAIPWTARAEEVTPLLAWVLAQPRGCADTALDRLYPPGATATLTALLRQLLESRQ